MHIHSPSKPKKLKQTLSTFQKAAGSCFLGREKSIDDGIHATRYHNNITSVLRNIKKLLWAIQNKSPGMLKSSALLLHDNARVYTSIAAHTRALLEHFNWELFDHSHHSPKLAPSDDNLFTYLKNWVGSQRLNNNEELTEGVKKWLSSQAEGSFCTGTQNLPPDTTASFPTVTTLRSSLSMCVFFVQNTTFFLIICFLTANLRLLSE
jgi:hypothetical protein